MMQNPFNGIERILRGSRMSLKLKLGIRSMELKDQMVEGRVLVGHMLPGIRSMELKVESNHSSPASIAALATNPFNGIESCLTLPASGACFPNPFNGIESASKARL